MDNQPLNIFSFPQAIVHLDADAFFASCEQAIHPELKGKPVITGKERGIVAAASYEAKARGVKRGMRLFEVKKVCPDAIILPSDYETYSLFSIRMFDILRRFSPDVEEYSIDEAFVDLTGLRRSFHGSYESIAEKMRNTIETELGITVSAGVSLSKVLAKIGSKHKKPNGLTMIPGREIHLFLGKLPVEKVWGIGANTSAFLKKHGILTALQFAKREEGWIRRYLSKPYREIWHELNGRSVYPVVTETKNSYQSISKAKTFTPASRDETFVFAQLSKNLENACIKARKYRLAATRLIVFLRQQDFTSSGVEITLSKPSAYPIELFELLRNGFQQIFDAKALYRQTGVVLSGMVAESSIQYTLFEDTAKIEKMSKIYASMDRISEKYGKHTIQHGASLPAKLQAQHEGERGDVPQRKIALFKGENKRQRLGMPLLHIKV
ncbi:MAG TPA: DNA polymerase IV [Thermodesulfovibrionales bacterium]|nr:DNA polymerase IV [Thermodesulfovibrionales bacterium]